MNLRMARAPRVVIRGIVHGRDRRVVVERVESADDQSGKDQPDSIPSLGPRPDLSQHKGALDAAPEF